MARELSALQAFATANNNARRKAFQSYYSGLSLSDLERLEFEEEWDAERGKYFDNVRMLKQALVGRNSGSASRF